MAGRVMSAAMLSAAYVVGLQRARTEAQHRQMLGGRVLACVQELESTGALGGQGSSDTEPRERPTRARDLLRELWSLTPT